MSAGLNMPVTIPSGGAQTGSDLHAAADSVTPRKMFPTNAGDPAIAFGNRNISAGDSGDLGISGVANAELTRTGTGIASNSGAFLPMFNNSDIYMSPRGGLARAGFARHTGHSTTPGGFRRAFFRPDSTTSAGAGISRLGPSSADVMEGTTGIAILTEVSPPASDDPDLHTTGHKRRRTGIVSTDSSVGNTPHLPAFKVAGRDLDRFCHLQQQRRVLLVKQISKQEALMVKLATRRAKPRQANDVAAELVGVPGISDQWFPSGSRVVGRREVCAPTPP